MGGRDSRMEGKEKRELVTVIVITLSDNPGP